MRLRASAVSNTLFRPTSVESTVSVRSSMNSCGTLFSIGMRSFGGAGKLNCGIFPITASSALLSSAAIASKSTGVLSVAMVSHLLPTLCGAGGRDARFGGSRWSSSAVLRFAERSSVPPLEKSHANEKSARNRENCNKLSKNTAGGGPDLLVLVFEDPPGVFEDTSTVS